LLQNSDNLQIKANKLNYINIKWQEDLFTKRQFFIYLQQIKTKGNKKTNLLIYNMAIIYIFAVIMLNGKLPLI